MDGVANTVNVNRGVNISQWVPSVDAVAEFKLQTGTLPAEYGRSGGTFMNIVIVGHQRTSGTAYEFLRNAALDANSFFNNRQRASSRAIQLEYLWLQRGRAYFHPQVLPGAKSNILLLNFKGLEKETDSRTLKRADEKMRTGDFSEFLRRSTTRFPAVS